MSEHTKSCFNFQGGKYRLLPQIIPLFPKDINKFVDVFCGGCNVGINTGANKILCNDISSQLIEFYTYIQSNSLEKNIDDLEIIIDRFKLSKENRIGYFKLRDEYNKNNRHPMLFYILSAHSNSNYIRFNKKGEFNLPFGKRTFNDNMRNNFIKFHDKIQEIDINFSNQDFRKIKIENLKHDDLIYFDSPYSSMLATYNERGGWSKKDDEDLFTLADKIHKNGNKFAMSNIYRTDWLKDWSKQYNVHFLNHNYKNSSANKKDRSGSEQEVLITNY